MILSAPVEYQATSRRFGIYWILALPETAARGLWALEAVVDGQPAGTHTFEVTAAAAPAAGRGRLSRGEVYQRTLAAVASVEALGSAGELLGQGAAIALDGDLVWTAFRSIEASSAIRLRTAQGRAETKDISEWNRRAGWATIPFPGHGLAPLSRAEGSAAVGDPCFVLDRAEDGSWVIADATIVGREQTPSGRFRLDAGFVAGSPVLDERGDVVGMVVGGGPDEELGPSAYLTYNL